MTLLQIEETLLDAVVRGTSEGLQMAELDPPPIGASRLVTASRPISVIVGMVGENNGTLTLNLTEQAMLHIASRFLMEEVTEANEEAFDAIGEIGNMIAGKVKDLLLDTPYETAHISVPSIILGANYNVYYTRGLTACSVEFELPQLPVTSQGDRFFSVTISFLRTIGSRPGG